MVGYFYNFSYIVSLYINTVKEVDILHYKLILDSTSLKTAPVPKKIDEANSNTVAQAILVVDECSYNCGFVHVNLLLYLFQCIKKLQGKDKSLSVETQPKELFYTSVQKCNTLNFNTTFALFIQTLIRKGISEAYFKAVIREDIFNYYLQGYGSMLDYFSNQTNFKQPLDIYYFIKDKSAINSDIIIVNDYAKWFSCFSFLTDCILDLNNQKVTTTIVAADTIEEFTCIKPTLKEYGYSELKSDTGLSFLLRNLKENNFTFTLEKQSLQQIISNLYIIANAYTDMELQDELNTSRNSKITTW